METFLEILKITIPSVIVFLTAFFVIREFINNETKKIQIEVKKTQQNAITPVRLQAYERLILLLERISPNNLVMRVHKQGMSARLLQSELIKAIRSEYEHNISQQIYVSNASWEMVITSKEEMIKLINIATSKVNDNATGLDLSGMIFEISVQIENMPTQLAIDYLKREIRKTF
jgi:hypothetical protein